MATKGSCQKVSIISVLIEDHNSFRKPQYCQASGSRQGFRSQCLHQHSHIRGLLSVHRVNHTQWIGYGRHECMGTSVVQEIQEVVFTVTDAATTSSGKVYIITTDKQQYHALSAQAWLVLIQWCDLTFRLQLLDGWNPRLPNVLRVDNKDIVLRETDTQRDIVTFLPYNAASLPSTLTLPEVVKNRRGRLGSATQNTASWVWLEERSRQREEAVCVCRKEEKVDMRWQGGSREWGYILFPLTPIITVRNTGIKHFRLTASTHYTSARDNIYACGSIHIYSIAYTCVYVCICICLCVWMYVAVQTYLLIQLLD